jgi:peptide/nickel transport system permease protein
MIKLVLTRIALVIPLLFGVATIVFLITHVLPGDVAAQLAGPDASPENIAAIRDQLGLNDPLWQQYLDYLGGLFRGDLGNSLITGRPVADELFSRLGATLLLVTLGIALATVLGIVLGALMAFSRRIGALGRLYTSLGLSTPDFVLGILLIFVFFYVLAWAPSPIGQLGFGAVSPPSVTGAALIDALLAGQWETAGDAASQLVLPVLAMGLVYAASVAKVSESSFREAKDAPFMDYARLTNLRPGTRARYLGVTTLPATLTYSGASYAYMLGGVVLIEKVFSWGGVAQYAADAISARDLYVIQGFVLIVAIFTFAIYLVLDLFYMAVDPRIRL